MDDYSKILSEKLVYLRKNKGYTQEILADKLGITFQAISKWETGISCPDIILLPEIADIFGVSIDYLFGINKKINIIEELPWRDDNKIRAVIYKGKKLINEPIEEAMKFTFEIKGEALNIESNFAIICGDVKGNVSAKGSIKCGDVGGDVSSNASVSCSDVTGNVSANGSITCADIGKDASTNGNICSADINGDVQCDGNITCAAITGDVNANTVKCREINGKIYVKKFEEYEDNK